MDWLVYINDLTTRIPVIGGTLAVTIAGGILAALWKGPRIITNFLSRNFTISFRIDNAGYGPNVSHFVNFVKWLHEVDCPKWSRSIGYEPKGWNNGGCGPSLGKHALLYKRNFYWVNISSLDSQGSEKEKRVITITTLGLNPNRLLKLFDEFKDVEEDDSVPVIRKYREGFWVKTTPIPERDWDSIILPEKIKKDIEDAIESFLNNEQWYKERGIPYKLGIVLHGKPGGAKTSLIKAIAHRYKKNIGLLALHTLGDKALEAAFDTVPKNTIIAIEDFDTVGGVKERTTGENESGGLSELGDGGVNLSTFLNVIDGVNELNGTIIIMTTNHINQIDSAILRPGRADVCIEIPYLGESEIEKYCLRAYPNSHFNYCGLPSMSGATLQQLVLKYRNDENGFFSELEKKKTKLSVVNN